MTKIFNSETSKVIIFSKMCKFACFILQNLL
nr:MAG TPA: hypothetical protein [Caudoviricetes sp.]